MSTQQEERRAIRRAYNRALAAFDEEAEHIQRKSTIDVFACLAIVIGSVSIALLLVLIVASFFE